MKSISIKVIIVWLPGHANQVDGSWGDRGSRLKTHTLINYRGNPHIERSKTNLHVDGNP